MAAEMCGFHGAPHRGNQLPAFTLPPCAAEDLIQLLNRFDLSDEPQYAAGPHRRTHHRTLLRQLDHPVVREAADRGPPCPIPPLPPQSGDRAGSFAFLEPVEQRQLQRRQCGASDGRRIAQLDEIGGAVGQGRGERRSHHLTHRGDVVVGDPAAEPQE